MLLGVLPGEEDVVDLLGAVQVPGIGDRLQAFLWASLHRLLLEVVFQCDLDGDFPFQLALVADFCIVHLLQSAYHPV